MKSRDAHSNDLELSIELAPRIKGLPEGTKIIFIGKEQVQHGDYIIIFELDGYERFFYGQPEKLREEVNARNRFTKQDGKRYYTIGTKQFAYFWREPHRSTIQGRDLKIYHTQKNPD